MAIIKTFLKYNGNKSIEELPICETDILILNCLSYCAFINSPKYDPKMENKFFDFSIFDDKKDYKILAEPFLTPGNEYSNFIEQFFKCERYKKLKFGHVMNHFSKEKDAQFFATTYRLGKSTIIVFRGTDNTIAGWKEDFNMALMDVVPAQKCAELYVEKVAKKLRGNFIVSGHSKGGNLAYYSFFNSPDELKERISFVYNLDGPGFKNDNYDYEKYKDKILKIVPNDDIVGVLFDTSNNYKIVPSTKIGVFAHDLLTWNLDRSKNLTELIVVSNLTPFSNAFKLTINDWFYSYDETYIKEMTDFIFTFVDLNDRNTLGEIVKDFIFHGHIFSSEFDKMDEKKKNIVYKMSKKFLKLYIKNLFSNDDTKLNNLQLLFSKKGK